MGNYWNTNAEKENIACQQVVIATVLSLDIRSFIKNHDSVFVFFPATLYRLGQVCWQIF